MSIVHFANIGKDRSKMTISNPIIFERWGVWYLQYRVVFENGTYKKKQQTTKVKVAEKTLSYMTSKWLPAMWARLQDGLVTKSFLDKTLGYFYQEYLSLKQDQKSLWKTQIQAKAAVEYFGEKIDVSKITRLDIKRYINTLAQTTGNQKDTIQAYLGKISAILELAVDAELIERNPCFGVKVEVKSTKNKDAKKPFEPDEVDLLLSNSSGELRNYLGIAFNTGMSPEEIIALMPQDIDFEKKLITICRVITDGKLSQDTKTVYRTRTIPLFDAALPYIQEQMNYAKSKRSLFLFCKENGTRHGDIRELRGHKINAAKKNNTKWYKLIEQCGIEDRPLKNCRHTFAVQAIKSGQFTLQQIADILGHVNLRMLISHYADYIDGNARNVDPSLNVYKNNMAEELAEGRIFHKGKIG